MLLEKGRFSHPSLRRHYPDQVCGFNLSLSCSFKNDVLQVQHPGNLPAFP